MNHDDLAFKALVGCRRWRDVGSAILLIGVVAELFIEAVWPETPISRPYLRGSKRIMVNRPKKWAHLRNLRALILLVSTLAVAFGIFTEWSEGTKADDKADQIVADAENRAEDAEETANSSNQRAIEASEHAEKLERENIKLRNLLSTRPEFLGVGDAGKFNELREFAHTVIWVQGIPSEMPSSELGFRERNFASWWYAGNIVNGLGTAAGWSPRLLHNPGDPHLSWIFGGVKVLTCPHDTW